MEKKINIEALLAKKEKISSTAIKSAIEKLEKQKEEAQEAQLLEHLEFVQRQTQHAITSLRDVRKQEKASKTYLVTVATAEENFYKDADFKQYDLVLTAARREFNKAIM